ncbi:class I SAM-dependent methyltransferase [Candidatus Uhrbacteria bacterium]|nr:class I SAM-dependent methyltransferase [Candidatus Uhrbacteria bacterium]
MITTNSSCRICKSSQLRKFLSLGDQPPANRFIEKKDIDAPEPQYPLDVYWCANCHLAQLRDIVDKQELFENYIYFSSGMPKLSDHFRNYAEDIMRRFLRPGDFVIELASNDGILLKFFKDRGHRILGVDPAKNIASKAQSLGVATICDFFSEDLAEKIAKSEGKAAAILANNVVAHINDHHDLAKGIAKLLDERGVFVLEAPYLVDMFENLTYDTIYHEHLSYLAVHPLKTLFEQFGLEIFDVEIHPVQGQSIRVFTGKKGAHEVAPSVAACIEREHQLGFDAFESYQKLAERVTASKKKLIETLRELKRQGKRIAAYGAPAKGNTVLNFCKIGTDLVDYALEDLPSKHALLTPGMHLPVVDRKTAESNPPDVYLLLAWNYLKPILAKEEVFRSRGGKFILPIGDEITIL